MAECANCENFDITQNKCYIEGKKCYANGKLLISECDKYEKGHWGIPEEIEKEAK